MKKIFLALVLSAITTSAFASFPLLRDLNLGTFKGRDMIRECQVTLQENREGKITATFSKDGLIHQSRPMNPEMQIMVSSNNQVWFDFDSEGLIHVILNFNNENDLAPDSYIVVQGRGTRIYKCRGLK